MPKFVIERRVENVGQSTPAELQAMSQKSCDVLRGMGPEIQWIESYVTGDKIYCVYIAENEAQVRDHARQAGFPADAVNRVRAIIDPITAEQPSYVRN